MDTIGKVRVGTPKAFRNLTVFPLFDGNATAAYVTLDEALARGSARITEVNEGGSVPNLAFVNAGEKPVLLLDGEELLGARQNRVLNLTILAPPSTTIVIPVSCVEAGRWSATSASFSSAPRTQYAEGRARKMAQVSASMERGSRASDQGAVWRDIDRKFERFGVRSPTGSMSLLFETESVQVEDVVQAFSVEDGQVGAIFAIEGRFVGFDLFDASDSFRKLFAKLLRSYALDAIEASQTTPVPALAQPLLSQRDAAAFLTSVTEANVSQFPAIGEGQDLRLNGNGISGAALLANDRIVHLAAFRQEPC